jgi:hypothetical protein
VNQQEAKQAPEQGVQDPGQEQQVNGVDHNLLDGYDGAKNPPPADFIARLLAGAPDEIKARAEAFAGERAGGGQASEKKPGQ